MKRALWWLACNAAFAAALWFGFVEDVPGARNVVAFVVCLQFVSSWVFFHAVAKAEICAKGPPVPARLILVVDFVFCLFLAWHESWILAALLIFAAVTYQYANAPGARPR